MDKEKQFESILEIINFITNDYFALFDKKEFEFYKHPNFTKNYRKKCVNNYKNQISKISTDEINNKNNKSLILSNLLTMIINDKNKLNDYNNIIYLMFDYLSIKEKITLYNLPILGRPNNQFENLDELYLKYIEKINLNQKINLICIIDMNRYCDHLNIITYPYIYQIQFKLFSFNNINELFMYNIPINDIYSIFIKHITLIKYYKNIKIISFGDEFFINKNQFLYYNDEIYQSIMSYLIDQYFLGHNKEEIKILDDIKLDKINIEIDRINNIYERFKIIYGLNKIFTTLKNNILLNIKYEDILNGEYIINEKANYKIIIIDFDRYNIDSLNIIISNINIFFGKINNNIKNTEILFFFNFYNSNTINNDENDIIIDSNTFANLQNLKEFLIKNDIGKPIIKFKCNSNKNKDINNSKFAYLYMGYDSYDNLIYYRNGTYKIKSTDILDIFNIYNLNIFKLSLKYEKIDIIFNKEKRELKIINLLKNQKSIDNIRKSDNFYCFTLDDLNDFIHYQKKLSTLKIEGFDFTFEKIKNDSIKRLYIHYFKNDDNNFTCNNLFKYKINIKKENINEEKSEKEDLYLKNKFPNLEEINIGNIEEERDLFNKLLIKNNLPSSVNKINIISYENFKPLHLYNNIDIKIIKKCNINTLSYENDNNFNENENYYDDEEFNDENQELFYDKYDDLFEKENLIIKNNKKHNKNIINMNEEYNDNVNNEIILVEEKIPNYKIKEENQSKLNIENYLKKENILYFKSDIIEKINHYYLIHQSFLRIKPTICSNNIHFRFLSKSKDIGYYDIKNKKNIFFILKTNKNNIICIFLKNDKYNEKGNDFLILLNENKVFYHRNIGESIKTNNNIIKNYTNKLKNINSNIYLRILEDIEPLFDKYKYIFKDKIIHYEYFINNEIYEIYFD